MNMNDVEWMIQHEAHFRLGQLSSDRPDVQLVDFERKRRLGNSLFGFDTSVNTPLELNGWIKRLEYDAETDQWGVPADLKGPILRHTRNADLIADIKPYGDLGTVYADMQDSVSIRNARFPIFQYNRRKGAVNAVLWPLRRVHDIGSENFFGSLQKDPVPFREKRPAIFWRGNLAGFSNLDGDIRNVRLLVDSFLQNEIDEELFRAHLETVPRYRFVSRFADDPRVDAGFVMSARHSHLSEVGLIARYVKPAAQRSDYINNRYLIALSGTDVSTVFGWAPAANVLLFKEDYEYEVFFDCHFQRERDFLSVRKDFSDVIEKFDWAESNLTECEEIIAHAHQVSEILGRTSFREASNAAFVELYRNRVLKP